MSRASTSTLLSLERFAKIFGLNPLHFCTAESALLRADTECNDVWYQFAWQDPKGKASREQIAELIAEAEEDLAGVLGYWPAPQWIVDEIQPYPRPRRRELTGTGLDIRLRWKAFTLDFGYVQYGGVRAVELLDTVDYVTEDADGDGFDEWAVFTVTVEAGLDPCEVQAFFKVFAAGDAADCRVAPSSTGADPAWEIRDIYASVSGTTLTVRTHIWNLLKPQLHAAHNADLIDVSSVVDPYVDEVTFYREYCDRSQQATFLWGDDKVCVDQSCAFATQEGCVRVRNAAAGIVVPIPATWDVTDEVYDSASWAQSMEPDAVLMHYLAGYVPPRGLKGCEPLNDFWARNIATLAVSRLTAPLCTCGAWYDRLEKYRMDKSEATRDKSHMVSAETLVNPFGTTFGEEWVWKRIKKYMRGRAVGGT